MKALEKIETIKKNNLSEWLKTRRIVEDELSERQSIFCICGKLATGLHEGRCRKFNQQIDRETMKRLEHLIAVR